MRALEVALEARVQFVPGHVAAGVGAEQSGNVSIVTVEVFSAESGRSLGVLVATREVGRAFSHRDVELMRACAARFRLPLTAGVVREQVAAAAIMDERARLAREIHDGIAQHLAFLKMRVAWLRRSPERIDPGQLESIENVLETALAEARYAITTLRADPSGTSTVDALAGYVVEFGQVSGLHVEVQERGTCPEVSPKARVEMLRIVQEALNNVRKHANASHVDVVMAPADGGLRIDVHDNGVGMTRQAEPRGHFGLDIMRERAESIGGTLRVASNEVGGTSVSIWVPGLDLGHRSALRGA